MLGLGLYLGEGSKYNQSTTSMSNCDPTLLKICISWLKEFFSDDFDKFSIYVHHYYPERDNEIRNYWSERLQIPLLNFTKSGFDVSISGRNKKGNTLLYGTVQVRVRGRGSWRVRQKIQKAIEVLNG